jgi:hypothetical protein
VPRLTGWFPGSATIHHLEVSFDVSMGVLADIYCHALQHLDVYWTIFVVVLAVAVMLGVGIFLYIKGPVTNPRALNVISWTIWVRL